MLLKKILCTQRVFKKDFVLPYKVTSENVADISDTVTKYITMHVHVPDEKSLVTPKYFGSWLLCDSLCNISS